jgi:hypothetical protein
MMVFVVVERKVVVEEGTVVDVALEHSKVVALLEVASFGGLDSRCLTPDHDHPSVRLKVGRIILLKKKITYVILK